MITMSILLTVLAIGFGIRKLCLMAMATMRKAADIKPEPAAAPIAR